MKRQRPVSSWLSVIAIAMFAFSAMPVVVRAGEEKLTLPKLSDQSFLGRDPGSGIDGHTLLSFGLVIAALGIVFGLVIYGQLKRLPVHKSMLEVSDLIYETCKTYLLNQGKFILILWACIAAVMVAVLRLPPARRATGPAMLERSGADATMAKACRFR